MFAQNVKCIYAYEVLKTINNSHLIDVRSPIEWNNDGIPDLSAIKKSPILIEWPVYMDNVFFEEFSKNLKRKFIKKDNLFFICKSGVRSKIGRDSQNGLQSYNLF